jgi:hypothetical protein
MDILLLLLTLFIIAHGLIHLSYLTPAPQEADGWPFHIKHSWLLSPLGFDSITRPVGLFLSILTALAFVLSGLGLLGIPGLNGLWQTSLLVGAAASVVLLVLFWDRKLILGLVIDAVLVVALLWNQSPLSSLVQS